MSITRLALAGVSGYLLGTLPSADVASRLARSGRDVRSLGSGNPGAANAAAVLGPAWGSFVLAADVGKGGLAASLGRSIAGSAGAHLGGCAAVIGHCFPVWGGFRAGGKGVATSAGQCLATFPAYFPIDLAVAYGTARWRRRASTATAIASGTWVVSAVVWWRARLPNAWGPTPGPDLVLAAAASSAVINLRFRQAARASGGAREDSAGD